MIYTKYVIIYLISNIFLLGCTNTKKQNFDFQSREKMYEIAQKQLHKGKWIEAIKILKTLDDYYFYSLSRPSYQVQLNLIYAYYKNSDLCLAQESINKFIRFHPHHPNIDYIVYIRGLINMELDNTFLKKIFNYLDRDPKYIYNAFRDFSFLIHRYPNSKYISDSFKRLVFLKNRLAKYEYSIVSYYAKHSAWIAVINRVETMLKNYQDTQATKDALKLMEKAYRKMHMYNQASKVARIIAINE